MKERKSVTLVELLIAMVLMGVVVLAAMAFDAAGREFFRTSERKAEALNELAYALDHVHKHVSMGIGDCDDPALTIAPIAGGYQLTIRQDINAATGNFNDTPADYTDDRTVTYTFNTSNGDITFNGEVIVDNNLVNIVVAEVVSPGGEQEGVTLHSIVARRRADEPQHERDNPTVSLPESFFIPFCQSSN
ncbi:MAG: hypothetical protein GF375_06960 [Candidatus Omnitrophica bacterium]|nr:hypothetical protein [Candidatus Omnitrophota bacterium]MBD3269716.1 hypothetical protein [Candidatus Omnitrophota bacterium]